MPQTIEKNCQDQIIAGVFSDPKNADKAKVAFQEMRVPSQDIQILAQPDKNSAGKVYTTDLQERGIAEPQARYYDEAIRKGKTFIAVHIAVFNLKL